jgi:class 3 adenylate cyclase
MQISSRTLICSVLFLDIVEYSKRPVEEQIQLKHAFNKLLTAALEQVSPRDRIILDTGDGAAVTFPGDPEDALFTAISIRDLVGALPVRMGINLGPVRLVRDINKQTSIIGDGINVAQRVMGFCEPGQLFVSRSFFEVVSCLSHDYANLFRHEGSRTDKHVRAHEIYSVHSETAEARRLINAASATRARGRRVAWWSARGPLGLRRDAMIAAPLAFFLIVGTALGIRGQRPPQPVPGASVARTVTESLTPETAATQVGKPAAQAPEAAAAARAAKSVRKPAAQPASAPAASAPPEAGAPVESAARVETASASKDTQAHEPARAAAPRPATPQPALIHLAVAPWGEVFVDGKSRGVSPPLRSVDVPPGKHTIEIRNASFPIYIKRIDVRPGDRVTIRHRFR